MDGLVFKWVCLTWLMGGGGGGLVEGRWLNR